jgi:hypothetical protein
MSRVERKVMEEEEENWNWLATWTRSDILRIMQPSLFLAITVGPQLQNIEIHGFAK